MYYDCFDNNGCKLFIVVDNFNIEPDMSLLFYIDYRAFDKFCIYVFIYCVFNTLDCFWDILYKNL